MTTEKKSGSQLVSELIGVFIGTALIGWAASYLSQRTPYPLGWWDATLGVVVLQHIFGGKKS